MPRGGNGEAEAGAFSPVQSKCAEDAVTCRRAHPRAPALGTAMPIFPVWGTPASATTMASQATSPPMLGTPEPWQVREADVQQAEPGAPVPKENSHFHHQKAFEGRAQRAFGHPCSVPTASGKCLITAAPARRLLAAPGCLRRQRLENSNLNNGSTLAGVNSSRLCSSR